MAECEDSEFTFFHEHIERHLHVKQLLLKTIWDLYGSSTTKVTKNAQSWVGMEEMQSGQVTITVHEHIDFSLRAFFVMDYILESSPYQLLHQYINFCRCVIF